MCIRDSDLFVNMVTVENAIGATIPTTFGQTKCNVLVDTGAMKSCMSQAFYQQLMLPATRPIHTYCIKSTNGTNLCPVGIIECGFKIGTKEYKNDFIVCKTSPILKYPDPNKPYTLFTDASKHAWACVLTQEYEHEKDQKVFKINHPITFASGLFKGSQLNWAALTKEAFAIYSSIKKLSYYLEDADIVLGSDHLPLKKFLQKNTCLLYTSDAADE